MATDDDEKEIPVVLKVDADEDLYAMLVIVLKGDEDDEVAQPNVYVHAAKSVGEDNLDHDVVADILEDVIVSLRAQAELRRDLDEMG